MDYENLPTLPEPQYFTNSLGSKLAYIHRESANVTLVFLHGYMSDMYGDKAAALYAMAQDHNLGFLALEYTANGHSDGDFIKDGSIGRWANDALELIEAKQLSQLILIGSSMGGWLAFWLAKRLQQQVLAVVGVAPAPDFTQDLMPQSLGEEGLKTLKADGVVFEPNEWAEDGHVPWTLKLYEDGKDQLVMNAAFNLPHIKIRLLQGMADDVVPWTKATEIAEWLDDNDVEIWMSKDGDHRLSTIRDLKKLNATILELLS